MKISQKSLAQALNLSERHIAKLVAAGMPQTLAEAKAWRRANLNSVMTKEGRYDKNPGIRQSADEPEAAELLAARSRRELALAKLAEMDLAIKRGDLVPLEKVEVGLANVARQIASILDSIPSGLRRRGSISAHDLDFVRTALAEARNRAAQIDPERLFADGSENTARAE